MNRPSVDIGVVTWNTRDLTVDCLRRVVTSSPGVNIRLLVHDNASSDGTAEAIHDAVPSAEVEVGASNLGFAAGMNRLIARSKSPWFLALNSDAWPEIGAIERLVSTAEAQPGVAVVAPLLLRPDGRLEHSTYPFPSLRISLVLATGAYRLMSRDHLANMLLEGYWMHDDARAVDWAVGAAWLMRRSAIDEIGGFEETFFMYAEDLEWCWRAQERGWQIYFEPRAVVRHVGNASGEQRFGDARTREYLRNTNAFYRRTHGRLSEISYRTVNALSSARWYLWFRMHGDRHTARIWASHLRGYLGR